MPCAVYERNSGKWLSLSTVGVMRSNSAQRQLNVASGATCMSRATTAAASAWATASTAAW
jgi:hypothetical protein